MFQRKPLYLLFALALGLVMHNEAFCLTLARSGKPKAAIVLADKPSQIVFPPDETTAYAAKFLQRYVRRVTGAMIPIISETESEKATGMLILIGNSELARSKKVTTKGLDPEGFRIAPFENGVAIVGEVSPDGIDRGTLFGVYEFIERVLGVRWYFGDPAGLGTVIPSKATVEFEPFELERAPRFRMRLGVISYGKHAEKWHPAFRFGDTLGNWANHTQFKWTDLYGDSHPEYFALRESGGRNINRRYKHRSYLCYSEPGVLKQMIENLKSLDKDGDASPFQLLPTKERVRFCPNDGLRANSLCHCKRCRKRVRPDGPASAFASELIFDFIARYATAIAEHWPKRRLSVLAYSIYREPPRTVQLPANVDVMLCMPHIAMYREPERNEEQKLLMKRWLKKLGSADRLTIWHYNTLNVNLTYGPIFYPHLLARWHRENVESVRGELCNGLNPYLRRKFSMGIREKAYSSYLLAWLWHRLLWDPDIDVDAHIRNFCEDLFGPAGKTMEEFFQLLAKRWETVPWNDGTERGAAFIRKIHQTTYPRGIAHQIKELLDRAVNETGEGTIERKRASWYRQTIFAPFLKESDAYQTWSESVPEITLRQAKALPVMDGKMTEPFWAGKPEINLVRWQWGFASSRRSSIRMALLGSQLLVGIRLEAPKRRKPSQKPFEMEEIRIQVARTDRDPKLWASNIDDIAVDYYREVRISSAGEVFMVAPKRKDFTAGVARMENGVLTIEAKVPLSALDIGKAKLENGWRMQVMRYWDVWNDFDCWSPTLATLSEYPVSRFGRAVVK